MKFTKMQGCGNDYLYINEEKERICREKKSVLVQKICDRHFGVGGDGVIFIHTCEGADFEMEMYNADGSRGEMCGNGIRCLAKYVYEKNMTKKTKLTVKSSRHIYPLELTIQNGQVDSVLVWMGRPVCTPEELLQAGGETYHITCVDMGNPHAVLFTKNAAGFPVERVGPVIEHHSRFPNRTNVEFVQVLDRSSVCMRVWERGTGETYACGTGACAAVAACVLKGLTDEKVTVKLLGGTLRIAWNQAEGMMYLHGPAMTVFEGEYEEPSE